MISWKSFSLFPLLMDLFVRAAPSSAATASGASAPLKTR